MEPTSGQFSNIYRKGGDDSGLRKRAVEQSIGEMDRTRKMTGAERYADDVKTGVQGARNAVKLNPTVKEATDNPEDVMTNPDDYFFVAPRDEGDNFTDGKDYWEVA